MGKFVFRLQALLNVKHQMENALKNELGKAMQELEHQKDILKQIENEKEICIDKINNSSSEGVSVGMLREYSSYISYLIEKAEFQKENINIAKDNVDKYREQLIKVMQEKEMLEKLKSMKFEEYRKEQMQQEQKLNDELASYKYMNQNS